MKVVTKDGEFDGEKERQSKADDGSKRQKHFLLYSTVVTVPTAHHTHHSPRPAQEGCGCSSYPARSSVVVLYIQSHLTTNHKRKGCNIHSESRASSEKEGTNRASCGNVLVLPSKCHQQQCPKPQSKSVDRKVCPRQQKKRYYVVQRMARMSSEEKVIRSECFVLLVPHRIER